LGASGGGGWSAALAAVRATRRFLATASIGAAVFGAARTLAGTLAVFADAGGATCTLIYGRRGHERGQSEETKTENESG